MRTKTDGPFPTCARFPIGLEMKNAIQRIANRRTDRLRRETGKPDARVSAGEVYREALAQFLATQPEGHEADSQLTVDGALARKRADT